ncbi:MAG: hypothetical protein MUC38_15025 [Cyclobacteriaceae bacterium]|nr:hypothetical protein [Cyclobacteriaceae bacterium]
MKITGFFFVAALACHGQKLATTFQRAEQRGISIAHLDERYMSAVHSDPSKAAFAGREQEVANAYRSLLSDLNTFLATNNFGWAVDTRCFNRIYFNANGTIDYFLFNFAPGAIEPAKERRFEQLVTAFVRDYQFPLTHALPFAQCSPATYAANQKAD